LFGLKDIKIGNTGPAVYLAARYKLTYETAMKFNLIYGHGDGSDVGSINANRGDSYTTNLFEISLQYEYYFLKEERKYRPFNLFNRRGMINNYSTLSFYGFLGAGGLFFDPKVKINPNFIYPVLQKEYISGYSKITPVIPLGLGIKISINSDWAAGFEFGRRFTFSPYLEGFNTSTSKSNDLYYFGVLHVIYKLKTDRRGVPLFIRKKFY
jgi:hypothetical protein